MPNVRFRYSLLTLLVLTALLAGGVKLWYGPHWVVESDRPNWQKEYSYTRDLRGNRIIDGPVIRRQFEGEKLVFFDVSYCRQGVDTFWACGCYLKKERQMELPEEACPLSEHEQFVLHQTRDAELRRLVAAGIQPEYQYEGMPIFTFFLSCER